MLLQPTESKLYESKQNKKKKTITTQLKKCVISLSCTAAVVLLVVVIIIVLTVVVVVMFMTDKSSMFLKSKQNAKTIGNRNSNQKRIKNKTKGKQNIIAENFL